MNIGLSQRILYHRGRAYDAIEHGWYSYLKQHTLCPVRNDPEQDFKKIAQSLDAFIITGGDDSIIRRTTEIKLAKLMMFMNKPVLGVCHGAFMLTDLLGGSVIESIPDHYETLHPVMYFGDRVVVNSFHSLAISQLHDSGTVLCTDSDGHIESWIDGTLAGVVWHPERMDRPWLPDEIENLLFKEIK